MPTSTRVELDRNPKEIDEVLAQVYYHSRIGVWAMRGHSPYIQEDDTDDLGNSTGKVHM